MKLCLVHMCLNDISGFLGRGVSAEDDEPVGHPRSRGSGKNGEFPEGLSKNLVPELLPAMAAMNAEVCEC
ncbi:hypothetical protein TNCV_4921141 [Trichonephila clavipes]|nr:hypothetical protein TNCV_4921141 [Trichonephila clavipes]